jgi:hypothetical protein
MKPRRRHAASTSSGPGVPIPGFRRAPRFEPREWLGYAPTTTAEVLEAACLYAAEHHVSVGESAPGRLAFAAYYVVTAPVLRADAEARLRGERP